MAHTPAEKQARYRDNKRGGPARVPQPCGTYAAYRRHARNSEEPCKACRQANTDYHKARRQ